MIQISIATFIVWVKKKADLKQLGAIWVVPMALVSFYYSVDVMDKIKTYMFSSNFFDVVMPERLFVYVLYALSVWVLPEKYKKISRNTFFLPVFLLFLASGFCVLFVDIFTKNSSQGFFSRYLIYLTPADILMFCFRQY